MKKKGFTLIELLGIIVILSLLAVITVPIVLGVIKKSEENSFKNSVYGIYESINYYYASNLDKDNLDTEFNFSKTVPLNYKGEKMVSGKIIIDEDGNKVVKFLSNGEYCANGTNNDIKISDDCIKLDDTPAVIDKNKIAASRTTKSIEIILSDEFAIDEESGIKNYEYIIKKDDKEETSGFVTGKTYKFNELTHDKEYEITIKVTNNNNKVNEVTIKVSTLKIESPTVETENVPTEIQNGYLKSQKITVTYTGTGLTKYVKTTREGLSSLAVTETCGTGIIPGECATISSTTSLEENTWYVVKEEKISITYDKKADSIGNIFYTAGDGINLISPISYTIDKIDTESPNVTLGTPATTTNTITIPIIASDEHSGLGEATCKYSSTSGSYTTAANSVSTTSCSLKNLTKDTTYYYQVCIPDKVGNTATCKTGSAETGTPVKPTIAYTNTPSTLQNGYLKSQKITITYVKGDVETPTYYVKTSRLGVSDLAVTKSCGTGTTPDTTCTTITSTTSLAANTWYVVSGNVSITYSTAATSTGTIYAAVGDGNNFSETLTGTIDKIDTTSPSVTLSTPTTSTNSITVPVTSSDSESGLGTATCKYSSTENKYTETAASASATSCSLTGLTKGTTYYYQVCIPDKVGNTATCKTGSAKTGTPTKPTIAYTNTPSILQNGYLKKQVATITYTKGSVTSPTYYVKTTRAGTGSISGTPCGTGTNPGTCSGTATTSYAAGTWYKVSGNVSVTYTAASSSTGTIYAAVGDGNNFSETLTGTIDKIDTTSPSVILSTPTTSTNSITIPVTSSDSESGLGTATCKYSSTENKYTETAASASATSCSLTGLTKGTTYYYQVCIPDKVGNTATCKTGSAKTGTPSKPTVTYTNTPSALQNGYLKKQVATVTYVKGSVTNPTYYVKTSRAGTGSLSGTPCGTGTNPGTCSGTATTSYAAGTWYKVSGNVSITYSSAATSTGTIYAAVGDGNNFSETLTGTIDKIDTTSPSVTLSTATTSTNSITIPVTSSDAHSGLGTATCKYSSTENKYTETAASASTTSCSLTGLTKGTTYYYQVCIPDKVGNTATCKTGSAKTGTPSKPTISYTNTPSTLQNGYLKKQVAKVTYTKGSVTNPTYYVKTSRAGTSSLAVTKSCGTGTNPGTCSTITSTTSLTANTWYVVSGNVSITYSTAATSTGTIYAAVGDGNNFSETLTGTIDKIDTASPSVTLSTATTSTNSITIPVTSSDAHSGLGTATCKYTLKTEDGYTTAASSVSTTSCSLTGLTKGTTYYYQVCIPDKVGNTATCKTGSATTGTPTKPTVSYTNTPSTLQNGYLKKQVAKVTYTKGSVTTPTYYVKTSRAGTSSLAVTKSCGTGTNPGTCSTITSTTSLTANTWYVVSGNVSITYSTAATSTGTIYAAVADNTGNLSETLSGTIDKIDTASPSVTLGTPTTSSNSITIPITSSDAHSGLGTATCKYTLKTEDGYTTAASSVSTTSCSLTGLTKGTTYYYQVCIPDKVGNTATCKTGSAKTGTPTKPTISYTNTPSTLGNGYLKKQVATVTYTKGSVTTPTYYVKTSRAGTSSLAVTKSCGTGTNPGTCSTITSTTSLAANTWYVVSGNVSVTYSTASSSTGTIYAAVADNTGNLSETLSGTIDKIDTSVPTGVSIAVSSYTGTSVNLTLAASDTYSGISKYIVYYGTSSSTMTTPKEVVTTATSTSTSITGLTKGTTYYFKVVAYDAVGNTTTSSTISKKVCTYTTTTTRYYSTSSIKSYVYYSSLTSNVTGTSTKYCAAPSTSCGVLYRTDVHYTSSRVAGAVYNVISGIWTTTGGNKSNFAAMSIKIGTNKTCKSSNAVLTWTNTTGQYAGLTMKGATKAWTMKCNVKVSGTHTSYTISHINSRSMNISTGNFRASGAPVTGVPSAKTWVVNTAKKSTSTANKMCSAPNTICGYVPLYGAAYYKTYSSSAVWTTYTASDVNTSVAGRTYYTTLMNTACN